MSTLSPMQWKKVHEAVNGEVLRLIRDRHYARRMARDAIHARIGEWIVPDAGRRVLELGAGPGRYAAMLHHLGFEVVGVDITGYEFWDEMRRDLRIEFLPDVAAESLPFPDESFDHVVCMGALLYFRDPKRAVDEMYRVLKPGGRLIVRTQNRTNLYTLSTGNHLDPQAPNLYTRDELCKLLWQQGFSVHKAFAFGFWPPFMHMRWWYVLNVLLSPWMIKALSAFTPSEVRHNVIAYAERPA